MIHPDVVHLGGSTLEVCRVGFGCCPMGGHGWGDVERDELIDAVHAALDRGVNLFDTADVYGLGVSEETLGVALRGRRSEAVIATKFGVRVEPGKPTRYDNSLAWLDASLDGSLRRLGVDTIDLYQIHYRDGVTPLEEVVGHLERKRQEGKIRAFGLSNPTAEDLAFVHPGLVSFQAELSLANRTHEPVIRRGLERGLTFLSWGSLGQGVLSGKYGSETTFPAQDRRSREIYRNFHGDGFAQSLAIVAGMRQVSSRTGRTLPAIAIRWILDHLPGSVVLVGIKRRSQLDDNLGALGWSLARADLDQLDALSSAGGTQ